MDWPVMVCTEPILITYNIKYLWKAVSSLDFLSQQLSIRVIDLKLGFNSVEYLYHWEVWNLAKYWS